MASSSSIFHGQPVQNLMELFERLIKNRAIYHNKLNPASSFFLKNGAGTDRYLSSPLPAKPRCRLFPLFHRQTSFVSHSRADPGHGTEVVCLGFRVKLKCATAIQLPEGMPCRSRWSSGQAGGAERTGSEPPLHTEDP